jgi:hypothetical protein
MACSPINFPISPIIHDADDTAIDDESRVSNVFIWTNKKLTIIYSYNFFYINFSFKHYVFSMKHFSYKFLCKVLFGRFLKKKMQINEFLIRFVINKTSQAIEKDKAESVIAIAFDINSYGRELELPMLLGRRAKKVRSLKKSYRKKSLTKTARVWLD